MWLSRGGVIEQADSVVPPSPPTVTSATIGGGASPSTIGFNTSEACDFSSTTGISVTTDAPTAITISSISGTGDSGLLTLSRLVSGAENITIVFAETNGVTSVASGLAIAAGSVGVTNENPAFTAPVFASIIVSSASANTSITSDSGVNPARFSTPQSTGLRVAFPNWVGYGVAGSAVTDTSILINYTGVDPGAIPAGSDFANFRVTLAPTDGGDLTGVPYLENASGSIQSRDIDLTPAELALISTPAVSGKGQLQLDILGLLSTAKGETMFLKYTDAVPASSANQGTQKNSFIFRFRSGITDVSGIEQTGEVSTENTTVETQWRNQSGPITVQPQLIAAQISESGNPGQIFGSVATAANGFSFGDIATRGDYATGQDLVLLIQTNPYVYNNITTPEPDPMQSALLSLVRATSGSPAAFSFDDGPLSNIQDFLAEPQGLVNIGPVAIERLPTTAANEIRVIESPFPLIPGMEIAELLVGNIAIPPGTTITNVIAGTDLDPFTRLQLSDTATGTGNDAFRTPNNGYIALNYSDEGSAGACNFTVSAPVNNFSIDLNTEGILDINAFSADTPSTDTTADYINQSLTGVFTA